MYKCILSFLQVAHIMAEHAKSSLKQKMPNVPMHIDVLKEPNHMAIGTASGIM